jgi:hypothetical protein
MIGIGEYVTLQLGHKLGPGSNFYNILVRELLNSLVSAIVMLTDERWSGFER